MKIYIDQIPIEVSGGTSVMEAAGLLGIEIPSMCYLPGHSNHPTCMVCLVKDEEKGTFFPSCAMPVSEGMKITTSSADVLEARKEALELLLSDHVGDCEAPCRRSCPAFMDIPLMNRLIASGDFKAALQVVREEIALPLVLGYICPAPCEKACHRASLGGAVSICMLKRFTANNEEPNSSGLNIKAGLKYQPQSHKDTNSSNSILQKLASSRLSGEKCCLRDHSFTSHTVASNGLISMCWK